MTKGCGVGDHEVDLPELLRIVERNHKEIGSDIGDLKDQVERGQHSLFERLKDYLLIAVYQADQRASAALIDALVERIKRMEQAQEFEQRTNQADIKANRTTARTAIWTGICAIAASVIAVLVQQWLKGG
jgi:hypothetical protein